MTLIEDCYGAPTTAPMSALSAINDFCEGFVGYEPRAIRPLEAVEQPYLEQARRCTELNQREKGLAEMLAAWTRYDRKKVIGIGEQLLKQYPQDLSTLKLVQYHAFNDGDAATMLASAKACEAANASRAPVHSMIAFGHEQLYDLDAAEAASHRALELNPAEPWAHHALAHIHLGRSTTQEGLAFLKERSQDWAGLNSFMFTHNWWHVALFEIAEGKADHALALYVSWPGWSARASQLVIAGRISSRIWNLDPMMSYNPS